MQGELLALIILAVYYIALYVYLHINIDEVFYRIGAAQLLFTLSAFILVYHISSLYGLLILATITLIFDLWILMDKLRVYTTVLEDRKTLLEDKLEMIKHSNKV